MTPSYSFCHDMMRLAGLSLGSTFALCLPVFLGWLAFTLFFWFISWLWGPAGRGEMLKPLPEPDAEPVQGLLSIVMPALNEEANIERNIGLLASRARDPRAIEIILVDAGSTDRTVQLALGAAKKWGVSLTPTRVEEAGRGIAQAKGAELAQGDLMMFLHADCIPPDDFDFLVRERLKVPGTLLVSFTLGFDYDASPTLKEMPKLDFVGWFVNLRTEVLKFPYGDQALTMKQSTYRALGGIKKVPMMEDFDFVRRAKRAMRDGAGDIVLLKEKILSHPRRWEKYGAMGVTIRNHLIVVAYRIFRLTPHQVYRLYYGRKPPAPSAAR